MATVSAGIPACSQSTPAATAEGATPNTGIPSACHAWRAAARLRDLPDPAGPTTTDTRCPPRQSRRTASA